MVLVLRHSIEKNRFKVQLETFPLCAKSCLLLENCKFDFIFFLFVDYVADEVLTYEEVALLQPDPQRKRPIVLIGQWKQLLSISSLIFTF